GVALNIPRRFTPTTRTVPTPTEVAPWVDAVATIWDDDAYAQTLAQRAAQELERYSFRNVAEQTVAFFNDVASR
ncbi:MAG: hypothetical protein IJZ10_04745, partial [Thermoguttaceae bacterium]|nr:hypothetical protein [Thermoguttaceae bacterium]